MRLFDSWNKFKVQLIEYSATPAIEAVCDRDTLDNMIVMAEAARERRKCDIHKEKMYMIRLIHPPSERLIAVIFIEDMEGVRRNVVGYYDEFEHMLAKGWESGDIKKFEGSPFDPEPKTAP